MPGPTRSDVEAAVVERIKVEPAFRERLLADPRAALAEITGTELPAVINVTVHEQSRNDIHLTIPSAGDLADADLELVAGGVDPWAPGMSKRSPTPQPPATGGWAPGFAAPN